MWFQTIHGILIFTAVLSIQTTGVDADTAFLLSFEEIEDADSSNSSTCDNFWNLDKYNITYVTSVAECSLQAIALTRNDVQTDYLLQYGTPKSIAIYKVYGDKEAGKRYVVMTYYELNMVSQIHIVATSIGSTSLTIRLPNLLYYTAPQCFVNYQGHNYTNGQTIHVKDIDHNETVTIKANCDLTGTFIVGAEKIAVFSGSYTDENSSLSFEQLMPIRTYGKYFVLRAYNDLDCENIISIVTLKRNTVLEIAGYDYIIIRMDFQQVRRKIENNESVYIRSSKPITVVQYIICTHDNAMILVPPAELVVQSYQSLPDKLLSNMISVPDSNFFTSQCVMTTGESITYIVDTNGSVYHSQFIYFDDTLMGGSILNAVFKITQDAVTKPMVPGDKVDNDNDNKIDEDECGDRPTGDGLDCEKLRYGTTRDLKGILFIAFSRMHEFYIINSGCDVNYTIHDSVIEIISDYECSVFLNTNITSHQSRHSIYLKQLVLPVDVLGLEYYAFTKCSLNSSEFVCNIAAAYDDTTIEIQGVGKHTLDFAYDYYFLWMHVDLSGKFIRANNPVSVFCICLEDTSEDGNTLNTMQLPPVDTWGKQFNFTLLQRDDLDEGQIYCTASTGNTIIIVKVYLEYMENTQKANYVYSESIFLNNAGDIESFHFERDVFYSIVAFKPIMVTLVYKQQNTISTVFVPPTEQATDNFELINGTRIPVDKLKINEAEFRQPFGVFNEYLYIATKFETINKPITVTEQTPRDRLDNDGDGLVDEDYCLFLLDDDGLIDLDLDGAYNEDCHGCDAGNELNTTFLTCEECQIGFYRNGSSKIDKCKACEVNYTTFDVGSHSCVSICFEGQEYKTETQSCEDCPVGYYKNISSNNTEADFDLRWNCSQCDTPLTTYDVGSEKCIPHCEEGYELSVNDTCVPCEIGFYKNSSSHTTTLSISLRWKCTRCPNGFTTLYTNSTTCTAVCPEGQEYNTTGEICEYCKIGYYKNISSDDTDSYFQQRWSCNKCNDSLTTLTDGSKHDHDCITHCEEGFQMDWENRTCSPCPIGWFKNSSSSNIDIDISARWNCTQCQDSYTTYTVASDKCLPICKVGQELDSTGTSCKACDIGYYKNTSSEDKHAPLHFRWNCTKCINSTTLNVGSDSCRDICDVGYELSDAVTKLCTQCKIGYFKNVSSDDTSVDLHHRWKCTNCDGNKTTYSTGAISAEQCIDSCGTGYQLAADNKTCEKCPQNTSKNDASIYTRCTPCPQRHVTMSDGSETCVELCRPGFEFNNITEKCQPCKLGFFKRDEGNLESCIECRNNRTTRYVGQAKCVPASCKCPCNRVHPVVNYTSAELAKNLEQLKKALKVNITKLSSTIRSKTSAKDNRPSSKTVGAFGIIIIAAVLLIFFIFDFVMIKHHIQIFMGNVRNISP